MEPHPDPSEVFTPARPVGPEMWASREFAGHDRAQGLQRRFEERIAEPGRQIVLYGDTGVGKTSLVEHVCNTNGIEFVRVECGQPLKEMLREALTVAGIAEERVEWSTKVTGRAGARGDAIITFSRSEREDIDTTTGTSYPTSMQTAACVALTKAGVRVLFLDNFENVRARSYGRALATEIAQLMKSFADRRGVKVVVAGISAESERLLLLDDATSRRTAEVEVPRMKDEELDEILQKGEARLGISFDSDCRAMILRYSDGFPYYTHLLALHATRAALAGDEARVSMAHFQTALDEVLEDADLLLRRTYTDAVETTGNIKVRKSIMQAMAGQEKPELTFREVRSAFQKVHPQYRSLDSLNFINVGLGELVEKYQVLQSRGIKKSSDRTYRFLNPLMRTYVLLRSMQDRRGEQQSL
jgi:AAA ATPase domain